MKSNTGKNKSERNKKVICWEGPMKIEFGGGHKVNRKLHLKEDYC